MIKKNGFSKEERTCSKIQIAQLFETGKSFMCYPFRVIYIIKESETTPPISLLINAPKRNFKRAYQRNLIKRQIRESFRLNKQPLSHHLKENKQQLQLALLYIGKELPTSQFIEKKIKKSLQLLLEKT